MQKRLSLFTTVIPTLLVAVALCDTPKPARPTPVKTAPIAYFEDRCARCHGPYGSFYGDEFARNLSEEALRKVVDDMCRVQGEAPLSGQDLEAQIAYHRALSLKEPFLAVTAEKDGELSGEVTEKATVTVKFRKTNVAAEVKGTTWKVAVPHREKVSDAVVTATIEKRSTIVKLATDSYSHGKPTTVKK